MSNTLSHLIELNRTKILRYGKSKLSHDQAEAVLSETIALYPDVEPSLFIELYSDAVAKRASELSDLPLLSSAIDQLRAEGLSQNDIVHCLVNALDKCQPATRELITRRLKSSVADFTSA